MELKDYIEENTFSESTLSNDVEEGPEEIPEVEEE